MPRFTPGTGVPYAGYGNVTGWLAGGRLEIGDGKEAGPVMPAGGTGVRYGAGVGGDGDIVACALTWAALIGITVRAKSARPASVRDDIGSFKLLEGTDAVCAV
jgi:hypothetical protein